MNATRSFIFRRSRIKMNLFTFCITASDEQFEMCDSPSIRKKKSPASLCGTCALQLWLLCCSGKQLLPCEPSMMKGCFFFSSPHPSLHSITAHLGLWEPAKTSYGGTNGVSKPWTAPRPIPHRSVEVKATVGIADRPLEHDEEGLVPERTKSDQID